MEACTELSSMRFKQRAVIEFLTVEGVPPIEIHRRMQVAYGNDLVDVSTVRRWAKKCKNFGPGRADLCDQKRSGRPVTATDESHTRKVDELLKDNQRITQREIADTLGISQERVGHLIDILGYRKVCARWVPRILTAEMKALRLEVCQQLLSLYENDGEEFLQKIVTADETWAHHYEIETKHQSIEYHDKGSPAKKKFKIQSSAGKILVTVFWDMDGVVHMDVLEPGTTNNSEHYIATLKTLKEQLRRVRKDKKEIFLQHDDTRPHTAQNTTEAVVEMGLRLLPHPPYSPDLAPCDFHLFPKLKEYLRGHLFDSNEEMEKIVSNWFNRQDVQFFRDGFQKLVRRWKKCVTNGGDYVEK